MYVCTQRERWLVHIHIRWMNELSICMYTQIGMDILSINIWKYQEGETDYLYTSRHRSRGVDGLFIYTQESNKKRGSDYQHRNTCTWRFYPQCWVCYFFTHYNDPHQQVGSSSYVINVAVPYSTHKCFAFVPACLSESVIHSIPLTLLLQPK